MSWECPVCFLRYTSNEAACEACNAPNPDAAPPLIEAPKVVFGGGGGNVPVVVQTSFPNLASTPVFGALGNITAASKVLEAPAGDFRRLTFGTSLVEGVTEGTPTAPTSSGCSDGKSPADYGKAFGKTFATPLRNPAEGPVLLGVESDHFEETAVETAILSKPGLVYTWGSGECEQLAVNPKNLNEENCRPTPIVIKKFNASVVQDVACGTMHCLAVKDGVLYSWGCPDGGSLGRPVKGSNDDNVVWTTIAKPSEEATIHIAKVPAPVWGLNDEKVVKVTAGDCHTAAITDLGNCYAWGLFRDGVGPIGFPNFENPAQPLSNQLMPVALPIRGVALDIASGENHVVVLAAEQDKRTLYFFGSSEFGQLGLPPQPLENRSKYLMPTAVTLDQLNFKKVKQAAGKENEVIYEELNDASLHRGNILHVFASKCCTFLQIEAEGSMRFFGMGRSVCGEVGAGVIAGEIVFPVELSLPPICPFVSICGGDNSVLGLSQDGSVWSWGKKSLLGLGEELKTNVTTPQLVSGLKTRAMQISSGSKTSYVCTRGGHLFAWGEGQSYQIGDGTDPDDPLPRPCHLKPSLFEFNFVSKIAAGAQHVLALAVENEQKPAPFISGEKKEAVVRPLKRSHRTEDEPDVLTPAQKKLRTKEKSPTPSNEPPAALGPHMEEPPQPSAPAPESLLSQKGPADELDSAEVMQKAKPPMTESIADTNAKESGYQSDLDLTDSPVDSRGSLPSKPVLPRALVEPSQDEDDQSNDKNEDASMHTTSSAASEVDEEMEETVKPKAKAKAKPKPKAKAKAKATAKVKPVVDQKENEKPATRTRAAKAEPAPKAEPVAKAESAAPKTRAKAKAKATTSRRKAPEPEEDEQEPVEAKPKAKPKRKATTRAAAAAVSESEQESRSQSSDEDRVEKVAKVKAKAKAKAKTQTRVTEPRATRRKAA